VGSTVEVKTTQRIPVTEDTYLEYGAKLEGTVVASSAGEEKGAPAVLAVRFTSLRYRDQTVPVTVRAVAIANFMDVEYAALPTGGGSNRGESSQASWTTTQIGGQDVMRSGWEGPLIGAGFRKVGCADYWGVYGIASAAEGEEETALPQALGVFSTTAKGLYGFESGATLSSSGGTITLTNADKGVVMRNGDNLLLEVVSSK
jgi:hypothetical protein